MDNKEQEKDTLSLGLDSGKNSNDNEFLVQKLKSIKEIINLLEKNFSQKEMWILKNSNLNNKFPSFNRQPLVFYLITTFTFLLILIRLIFLQLLNHETYKKMSDENRIRLIATQPIRGRILDKNGMILADSRRMDRRCWHQQTAHAAI